MDGKAKFVIGDLAVEKLRRVSPSRYDAMRACLLREVWNASGEEFLLPAVPAAELGKVIHRLLEAAGRGQLGDATREEVDKAWDRLIGETEEHMSKSWLSRPLVPLSRSMPDFEVRRIRGSKRAMEIAREASKTREVPQASSNIWQAFEFWAETEDGVVGGFIDRARDTPEGVIISDYKSGAVLEDSGNQETRALKKAHRVQMELYAALYWCTFQKWPVRLEVVPLQGATVSLHYVPEAAVRKLTDARNLLQEANAKIEKVGRGESAKASLASPRAENCWMCLFRPGCEAYWSARKKDCDQKWPNDIRGEVIGINMLRNGRVCFQVAVESKSPETRNIRNITNAPRRHPALTTIQIGSGIAIFGLKHLCRTRDYSQTDRTVIYKLGCDRK